MVRTVPWRDDIIAAARAEIGQKESPIGSNWGGKIPEYLASVGISTPAPWCAGWLYWVFNKALGEQNPLPRTGYTPLIHRWAKTQKRVIPAVKAQPADLVLFYFPSLRRVGHVAIVGLVQLNIRKVFTIEGNTNTEGAREGHIVARKLRPLSDRMIFVRTGKLGE